jgi:hypothetical protein
MKKNAIRKSQTLDLHHVQGATDEDPPPSSTTSGMPVMTSIVGTVKK